MKVLVIGANGQLGHDLVTCCDKQYEVFGFGREKLNITDLEESRNVIHRVKPDVIVHAAAYTAVDAAESDEEQAYAVNAFGSRNIALIAEEIGAKVCFISTDYVFDGHGSVPYREYDQTNPQGIYGKSKLAGEHFVQSFSSKYFIVRTSWVYGLHGNNFVKTMLKLAKQHDRLKVVHDQIGSPTYTVDLCHFISQLIRTEKYGIYHASNSGTCSWYEFAMAIFEASGITIQVDPCTTEEFPRPAPRPKYSVMEHLALRANGFSELPHWREALQIFLQEYKEQ